MVKTLGKPKAGAGKTAAAKTARVAGAKTGGGWVRYWVRGPAEKGAARQGAPSAVVKALKAGLPVKELDDLRSALDLPMDKLAPLLGISKATLHRRKGAGKLDAAESDRVLRLARLLGQAAAVMESLEAGRRWLAAPQIGLGGATPLAYAETEAGAREVEALLGRIEHGVYS